MTTPHNPYQTMGTWPAPDSQTTEHGVIAPDYRDDYPESDPTLDTYAHPGATVPLGTQYDPDETEPIPVRVVSQEQPTETRRRFSTTTVPMLLANQLLGNQTQTVRIVGMRPNRTKVKVTVKNRTAAAGTAGRVWVSADEYPGVMTGYPLDYGDSFESNTTDDIWAVLDPAAGNDALVCVYEEWEVTMPVHHAHKTEGKHLL